MYVTSAAFDCADGRLLTGGRIEYIFYCSVLFVLLYLFEHLRYSNYVLYRACRTTMLFTYSGSQVLVLKTASLKFFHLKERVIFLVVQFILDDKDNLIYQET